MPTIYPPLQIGARRRLEIFKREAAQPNWARPLTWRDVRFAKLSSPAGLSGGFNGPHTAIWYTHDAPAFPEKFADEVLQSRGRGYYTDIDARGTARGIVARLPHGRFLAGYLWSDNGERVYFGEIHTDERDAAHAADGHAERFADEARDDSQRSTDMMDLELEINKEAERLTECFMLRQRGEKWRDEARDLCGTIRNKRKTLARDYGDM